MADNIYGNIETLLSQLGLQFQKKSANQYFISCPFHAEKTPSLSINSEGLYNCFGCGATGNAFSLVKHITGQSLYQFLNITSEAKPDISFSTALKIYQNKIQLEKQKEKIPIFKITAEMCNPFEDDLCKTYCIKRNILESDIEKYEIFYIKRGYINNTIYHKRLVIPIYNDKKVIVAYEGRDVTEELEKKCIYPYQSKVGSTIFQNHLLDRKKPIVFVEGVLDYIVAQRAIPGIQFSTYFGIQLSNTQMEIVNEFKDVSLMLDPEESGQVRGNLNFDEIYNGNFEVCSLTRKDPNESTNKEIINAFENRISITEFHLRNNDLLQQTATEW